MQSLWLVFAVQVNKVQEKALYKCNKFGFFVLYKVNDRLYIWKIHFLPYIIFVSHLTEGRKGMRKIWMAGEKKTELNFHASVSYENVFVEYVDQSWIRDEWRRETKLKVLAKNLHRYLGKKEKNKVELQEKGVREPKTERGERKAR